MNEEVTDEEKALLLFLQRQAALKDQQTMSIQQKQPTQPTPKVIIDTKPAYKNLLEKPDHFILSPIEQKQPKKRVKWL